MAKTKIRGLHLNPRPQGRRKAERKVGRKTEGKAKNAAAEGDVEAKVGMRGRAGSRSQQAPVARYANQERACVPRPHSVAQALAAEAP